MRRPLVTGRTSEVDTTVASTGPTMKASSSTAASREKAVWMSSGVCSSAVQRERTREAMEPLKAPAPAARSTSTHRGASSCAATVRPRRQAPDTRVEGSMTRRWPCTSMRRASRGAPTATATMFAAETVPAAV